MAGQWYYNPFTKKLDYYDDADTKLAKSSNLSDVANTATAFGNIKQAATESATGVAELATVTEAVTGTDTSRITTPQGVATAIAVYKNPLAFAQGIYLTAATSGSSGIVVADSAVYENTTNNFGHEFGVSLPDYTPSANVVIGQDTDGTNGWVLYVLTTGYLRLTINDTNFDSTATLASVGVTDGYPVAIGFSVTRSATLDSVLFAVNGYQLGNDVTSANEAGITVANASDMYTMGTSTTRSAGRVYYSIPYNRAKIAAEHLAFFKNGIDYADKWGSQTAVYTSNFSSGADSWDGSTGMTLTGNTDGINGSDDWLKVERTGTAGRMDISRANTLTVGKTASVKVTIYNDPASTIQYFNCLYGGGTHSTIQVMAVPAGTEVTATLDFSISSVSSSSGALYIYPCTAAGASLSSFPTGTIYYVKNIVTHRAGATLALEPEGIQPAPGQWLDSSTNKLHAWQPATGSSLTRYKNTFEIRGINTWAGTHEAQSITMLTDASRAMLPANCYIDEIIGVIAGATIEDIIIGDGSDTDHWVAATTGLAAGTVAFTIANHISDGTNMEMVVDPDANFTGTITWTIRGHILD